MPMSALKERFDRFDEGVIEVPRGLEDLDVVDGAPYIEHLRPRGVLRSALDSKAHPRTLRPGGGGGAFGVREDPPHRDCVAAGADDQEAVEAARESGKCSSRLGAQAGLGDVNGLDAKPQNVGGEPVPAGKDEFGWWREDLDVKAGHRRTFGQRTRSTDGLVVTADGACVPRREATPEEATDLADQGFPHGLGGGIDQDAVLIDEGHIQVRHVVALREVARDASFAGGPP